LVSAPAKSPAPDGPVESNPGPAVDVTVLWIWGNARVVNKRLRIPESDLGTHEGVVSVTHVHVLRVRAAAILRQFELLLKTDSRAADEGDTTP
jgi:hypothetical protein